MLLSVLMRCSLSLTTWFLQRFMKDALNSLFVDGLRSPIGDRLASFRWMYSFSISSERFTWFPATTGVRSHQHHCLNRLYKWRFFQRLNVCLFKLLSPCIYLTNMIKNVKYPAVIHIEHCLSHLILRYLEQNYSFQIVLNINRHLFL